MTAMCTCTTPPRQRQRSAPAPGRALRPTTDGQNGAPPHPLIQYSGLQPSDSARRYNTCYYNSIFGGTGNEAVYENTIHATRILYMGEPEMIFSST
jgi:hypothetical protein